MSGSTGGTYYSDLRYTPWADELTLSFTQALIKAEKVGQGDHPDYLSVSFSATDYVGHSFGPNSLEAEDNLLRLDRTLARLFESIEEAVGLDSTLIVLSSDHGVQAAPEHLEHYGFEAGRLGTEQLLEPIDTALSDHFDVMEGLLAAFVKPNLYLDLAALERADIDVEEAETALAGIVMDMPGFSYAFTRSDLVEGDVADTPMARAVLNAFHPERSGNVYAVSAVHWYFGSEMKGDAATHGTWHAPDTFVPLVFAGPGIGRKTVHRRVAPRDIAPTLSAIMGSLPPSGSVGEVLIEVAPR
jgi:predicted AlkP superfamily pyrophosphatase or phosphodiesterase